MNNKLKEFSLFMVSIGAIVPHVAYSPYQWEIETIYGILKVSIHDSDFTKGTGKPKSKFGNLVSIYTSFKDFDRAKEYLIKIKCEKFPTTGKVNYHRSGGNSEVENWNENFERFKNDLDKILIKKTTEERVIATWERNKEIYVEEINIGLK